MSPSRLPYSLAVLLVCVAAYLATGVFIDTPRALLAGLVAAFALRLAFSPDRAVTFAWALVLALVGCVMEGAISSAGGFAYHAVDVFNVPYWLAALYLNGSFLVLQIVRRVETHYGSV